MRRIATACLAGALLLAGCGGDDDGDNNAGARSSSTREDKADKAEEKTEVTTTTKTPVELISAASEETLKAETSKFSMHFGFEISGVPGAPQTPTAFDATGEYDYRKQSGRMVFDLSAIAASVPSAPKSVEMLIVDKIVYLKSAGLGINNAREWVKLDPAAPGGGVAGFDVSQFQSSDPTKALEYLKAASKDVKEVGRDTVRGEETTHLRATLDTQAIAGQLPAEMKDAAAALNNGAGIPLDVWIDGDGRMRKMAMTLDMSALFQGLAASTPTSAGGGGDLSKAKAVISMSFELFDFGTDVDVSAPPPDQVSDGATLR